MTRRRPITFIIFAILNFIAAAAFIGCGVCANVSDARHFEIKNGPNRWDEKMLSTHLKDKVPAYLPVKIGGIVTGYLVCVGLILSGVAMLFGGFLSKIFALVVYASGFLHHFVLIIYQFVWVNPATNQFFDAIPPLRLFGIDAVAAARFTSLFGAYVSITWWILGCLFYIVAAGVVGLSSTAARDDKDADSKPVRPSKRRRMEDDEDDDEEDDDDRPRKKRR